MGEEVIKILEYLKNSDIVKGFAMGYVIIGIIVFILAITIFIITFRNIMKNKKEMNEHFNKR